MFVFVKQYSDLKLFTEIEVGNVFYLILLSAIDWFFRLNSIKILFKSYFFKITIVLLCFLYIIASLNH